MPPGKAPAPWPDGEKFAVFGGHRTVGSKSDPRFRNGGNAQMENMNQSAGLMLRKSRYTMARLAAHGERKLGEEVAAAHGKLAEQNAAFNHADDHRIDVQAGFDEVEMIAHERFVDL